MRTLSRLFGALREERGTPRTTLRGEFHLNGVQGAIIAANHPSLADWLSLRRIAGREVIWALNGAHRDVPKPLGWVRGRVARGAGRVYLEDPGTQPSAAALQILADGGLVGVFPEGAVSPDERLYQADPMVGRLVIQARVPVVPLCLQREPNGHSQLAVLGPALDFSRFWQDTAEEAVDAALDRAVADEISQAILALGSQSYVDLTIPQARQRRREQAAERRRMAAEQRAKEAELRKQLAQQAAEQERSDLERAEQAAREHAAWAAEQDELRRARLAERDQQGG